MKRRDLIATAAVTSVAGCLGNNKQEKEEKQVVENPPENVAQKKETAQSLYNSLEDYFDNLRVMIDDEGDGYLITYDTKSESSSSLTSEINQVASIFIDSITSEDAVGYLIIRVGKVEAVVPEAPVNQRKYGDLEEDAYYETIQIRSPEDGN